jgi:hypothetical protein
MSDTPLLTKERLWKFLGLVRGMSHLRLPQINWYVHSKLGHFRLCSLLGVLFELSRENLYTY